MSFLACIIFGEQAEHGFDTKTAFQTAGGTTVGGSGNLGIVLTVGGKAHDIVPVKVLQSGQMVAVEAGIVSKDRIDTVLLEPDTQIRNGLSSSAEDGPHWRFNERGTFIHIANLTLNGQNMIFCFAGCKSVRISDDCADAHNLILPLGFCIDYGKSTCGSLLGRLKDSILENASKGKFFRLKYAPL